MIKISFDWDGTLADNPKVVQILEKMHSVNEVYKIFEFCITTRRYAKPYIDTRYNDGTYFSYADEKFLEKALSFGFKEDEINYCNYQMKAETLYKKNIHVHFDDDYRELEAYKKLLQNKTSKDIFKPVCKIITVYDDTNWQYLNGIVFPKSVCKTFNIGL